eukprot:3432613-Ditylum_brightwellii.AAC.1
MEEFLSSTFKAEVDGTINLEDEMVLFNDLKNSPPEQYHHTDFDLPEDWVGSSLESIETLDVTQIPHQEYSGDPSFLDDRVDNRAASSNLKECVKAASVAHSFSYMDKSSHDH